jgi:two-component system, NtrC family, nitrogen regulation sensor histidine kinase NtrY
MVYKRLYIQVIIRVILLLATCIVLSRILFDLHFVHTAIVLSAVLLIETMELTRYLNRTNRQLSKFFTSILDQGSSLSLNENNQTGPFRELIHKLGEINNLIQLERRERKAEYTYLNYIIENIGVGVVTFKENGSIDLINPAAKKIFPEEILLNLSDLNKFNPEFERSIKALELNEGALIRIIVRNELFYLTVRKSLFKLHGDPIWLISFQDINSELDKKELESWQKIIRVLTHEIMSSISPVCSLSEHLLDKTKELYHTGVMEKAMEDKLEDIMEGLDIIKLMGVELIWIIWITYLSLFILPGTKDPV